MDLVMDTVNVSVGSICDTNHSNINSNAFENRMLWLAEE